MTTLTKIHLTQSQQSLLVLVLRMGAEHFDGAARLAAEHQQARIGQQFARQYGEALRLAALIEGAQSVEVNP